MSAQPNRAPDQERDQPPGSHAADPQAPRLRSRPKLRAASPADAPGSEPVSHLRGRVQQAFGDQTPSPDAAPPPRGDWAPVVIKVLMVAATCVCVVQALSQTGPLLGLLLH